MKSSVDYVGVIYRRNSIESKQNAERELSGRRIKRRKKRKKGIRDTDKGLRLSGILESRNRGAKQQYYLLITYKNLTTHVFIF